MRDPDAWDGWSWSRNCVERINDMRSLIGAGFDMVKYGPWRFFWIDTDKYAAALEWETAVEASYEDPWDVYSAAAGTVILPGGTPRKPFAEGSALENPCGSRCAW